MYIIIFDLNIIISLFSSLYLPFLLNKWNISHVQFFKSWNESFWMAHHKIY
jgi:hypothetical protein